MLFPYYVVWFLTCNSSAYCYYFPMKNFLLKKDILYYVANSKFKPILFNNIFQKYYRSSTLPESPAPLTPKKFNFLSEEEMDSGSPLRVDQDNEVTEKETPTSPFITFGKTPPKVFRSKKFQLFGSSKEVALVSLFV